MCDLDPQGDASDMLGADITGRPSLCEVFEGHGPGPGHPTLASWSTAVVELAGPKTTTEARELIRELRVLLAGDPA